MPQGRESVLLSLLGPAQGHVFGQLLKTKVRWLAPFQNRFDDIRREEGLIFGIVIRLCFQNTPGELLRELSLIRFPPSPKSSILFASILFPICSDLFQIRITPYLTVSVRLSGWLTPPDVPVTVSV